MKYFELCWFVWDVASQLDGKFTCFIGHGSPHCDGCIKFSYKEASNKPKEQYSRGKILWKQGKVHVWIPRIVDEFHPLYVWLRYGGSKH